ILVYRDQVCNGGDLTETWFFRAVNQMLDSGAERSMTYAKAALHYLKVRDFQKELDDWITAHQSADWRMLIELRTLEFLSSESPTSASALEFWQNEIQERAEKHLIASP